MSPDMGVDGHTQTQIPIIKKKACTTINCKIIVIWNYSLQDKHEQRWEKWRETKQTKKKNKVTMGNVKGVAYVNPQRIITRLPSALVLVPFSSLF